MSKIYEELLPLKYGVLCINFLLWTLGVVLMGVCIWIRSDSALWAYADNMDIYRYYQASYIGLTIAAVILIIGILGCIGAVRQNNAIIFGYSVVAVILIVLEVVCVVLVWKIPGGDMLQQRLGEEFKWHMEQRIYNQKSRQFLDLIQLKLECCGAETMRDYRKMWQDIPASCNCPRTNNINIRSCSEMLRRYLEKRGGALGGLVCSLILVKIGAFLFSFMLVKEAHDIEKEEEEYATQRSIRMKEY